MRQSQVSLFAEPLVDEFRQAQRRQTRNQFERQMQKLAPLTSVLTAVLELDPGQLADALGPDVVTANRQATELARLAGRMRNMLAAAEALHLAEVESEKAEAVA
jgi:hypothetical protein